MLENRLTAEQTKILINEIEEHSPSTVAILKRVVRAIDIDRIKEQTRRLRGHTSKVGSASAKNASDFSLLTTLQERLKHMEDGGMNWTSSEAMIALEVLVGLSDAIVAATEGEPPVIDRNRLHESKHRLKELTTTLGHLSVLAEAVPETPEEINRAKHETWGLHFKVYENEAPTVYVDGKGHFEISDAAASVLYIIAGQTPGQTCEAKEIMELFKAESVDQTMLGIRDNEKENNIRRAIHDLDVMLRRAGKERHVIFRAGATRVVHFGLLDK